MAINVKSAYNLHAEYLVNELSRVSDVGLNMVSNASSHIELPLSKLHL